jgi:hypothetical protein
MVTINILSVILDILKVVINILMVTSGYFNGYY